MKRTMALVGRVGSMVPRLSRRLTGAFFGGLLLAVVVFATVAFARPGDVGRALLAFGEPPDLHSGAYSCVECHDRPNPDARLWAAVNGTPISAGKVISAAPGDTFEVDFHFTNMVFDVERFHGVGAEMLLPAGLDWRVGVGTPNHPQQWQPGGQEGYFWSPTWDRTDNGDGPVYARWVGARDRAGAYVLSFAGVPWNETAEAVVAADRGKNDPGDRDDLANHMGSDAIIQVSAGTPPGQYEVTLLGIGHDKKNERANVSLAFTVQVERGASRSNAGPVVGEPDQAAGQPMTSPPTPPSGPDYLYRSACASCHGATPGTQIAQALDRLGDQGLAKVIAEGKARMAPLGDQSGGKLTAAQIDGIVKYIVTYLRTQQQLRTGGPAIDHTVSGRLDCLACHDAGGVRPKPGTHEQYKKSDECNSCHRAAAGGAPEPSHPFEGHEACLSCHASNGGQVPMPDDHGARSDRTCRNCHEPLAADSGPGHPPFVRHTIAGRKNCLLCHDIDQGFMPVPQTHVGRRENTCLGCHKVNAPGPPAPTPAPGVSGGAALPAAGSPAPAAGAQNAPVAPAAPAAPAAPILPFGGNDARDSW